MPVALPPPAIDRAGLSLLAVGAHPDDVEIGAAALLTAMRERGHEVHILVLTDDPVNGTTRRAEARNAAAEMGVPPERVIFAGIQEGYLRADIDAVRRVRQVTTQVGIRPDIVVTHARSDSHNDHVEANGITHAAFRDCAFLHYLTHVSAEVSNFRPTVFVEVNPDRLRVKENALKSYHSQLARIGRHDLKTYEERFGRLARLDRAEGFEVCLQYGADEAVRRTIGLSDSPFHRFWLPTVGEDTVTLLYESPTDDDTPETHLRRNLARDRLRQAFVDRWSPYPLREHCSATDEATAAAGRGSIVTVGGPAANPVARACQALAALVWTVEGSGSGSAPRRLWNRDAGTQLFAASSGDAPDLGYVARLPNPLASGANQVAVAGVTDAATWAGVDFLADPSRSPAVASVFDQHPHAQVVYAAETGGLRVVDVQVLPTTEGAGRG